MIQQWGKWFGLAVASLCALGAASGSARAQGPDTDELRARVERLEKQNQELLNLLKNAHQLPTAPGAAPGLNPGGQAPQEVPQAISKEDVTKIVTDYLTTQEQKKAAAEAAQKAEAEAKGFVVGKD